MSSLGTLWAEGQVSWRGTRFLRLMLQDSTVASPRERVRSKPQILRGCEADLVRHGQGGWARRRASAGREVGPLPGLCPAAPRASEPPVSGWQPSRAPRPRAREGGARRGARSRLTSRTLPGPGAPGGAGLAPGSGRATAWEAPVSSSAPSQGPRAPDTRRRFPGGLSGGRSGTVGR